MLVLKLPEPSFQKVLTNYHPFSWWMHMHSTRFQQKLQPNSLLYFYMAWVWVPIDRSTTQLLCRDQLAVGIYTYWHSSH